MKAYRIFISSTLFFIAMACEEKFGFDFKTTNTGLLVVEAILTNEKTNQMVRLTLPHQQLNEKPEAATGALVSIMEGSDKVFLLEEIPVGSGEYFTEELTAVSNRVYTLTIQYQGKTFTAQNQSVPVEPMPPLAYQALGDGPSTFRLTPSAFGNEPNFIRYTVNWSGTPACVQSAQCKGEIYFYDLKSIDVAEVFKTEKADFTFPANTVIIRKKFSVNPLYKDFLRSALSEAEWRGGFFDVERDNLPTNLSEGAIGFFAVSTVVTDTTLVR